MMSARMCEISSRWSRATKPFKGWTLVRTLSKAVLTSIFGIGILGCTLWEGVKQVSAEPMLVSFLADTNHNSQYFLVSEVPAVSRLQLTDSFKSAFLSSSTDYLTEEPEDLSAFELSQSHLSELPLIGFEPRNINRDDYGDRSGKHRFGLIGTYKSIHSVGLHDEKGDFFSQTMSTYPFMTRLMMPVYSVVTSYNRAALNRTLVSSTTELNYPDQKWGISTKLMREEQGFYLWPGRLPLTERF